jgi:hypothetical protein
MLYIMTEITLFEIRDIKADNEPSR